MVSLVVPAIHFESSYRDAFEEFDLEGRREELERHNAGGTFASHGSFAAFVGELHDQSEGRDLPDAWVAQSTFWLVDDDDETFVGKVEIRHELTDALRLRGGHVGYAIRPTMRGRGYGTLALAMAMPKCLELGLDRVLVTCDTTNAASQQIIVRNGGEIQDVVHLTGRSVPTMRFWVDVARQCRFAT